MSRLKIHDADRSATPGVPVPWMWTWAFTWAPSDMRVIPTCARYGADTADEIYGWTRNATFNATFNRGRARR